MLFRSGTPVTGGPVKPSGAASIGAFRPWAPSPNAGPRTSGGIASHRRIISIVGGALLIAVLIVGAAIVAGHAGPGGPGATATPTNGGLNVASSRAEATATPAPTASPSPSPSLETGPVTASTPLDPDRGSVISTDNFQDSHSGWATSNSNTADTTYQFGPGGYSIGSLTGMVEHLVYGPYRTAKRQLSMSVTATLTGAPSGAGLGVTCRRGTGAAQISYSFVVLNTGRFYVERYDGVPGTGSNPTTLKRGASSVKPGSLPITVVGMCATLAGGTTRLALFVEGQKLADLTDFAPLTGTGWAGGIDMASGKTQSTLTAANWVERDLSK